MEEDIGYIRDPLVRTIQLILKKITGLKPEDIVRDSSTILEKKPNEIFDALDKSQQARFQTMIAKVKVANEQKRFESAWDKTMLFIASMVCAFWHNFFSHTFDCYKRPTFVFFQSRV